MAMKANKQCQLAQTMLIYLVPKTEVSLFFSFSVYKLLNRRCENM